MFITAIKIKNFMPYYGEIEIKFSKENNERNIYLIIGDNGYGKTSFLNAVYWAFFGGKGIKHNNKKHNSKALSEAVKDMAVSIIFRENDQSFILTRKHVIDKADEINLGLRRDNWEGEVAQEKIRGIFPENTAQFFIFEGEMVRELAKAQGQQNARSSIEILLGLQALRNAVEDLQQLESEYRKGLAELQSEKDEYGGIKKEHKNALDEIKSVDNKIALKVKELSNLQNAEENYEHELSKVEENKGKVERKKRLLEEIEKLKKDLGEFTEKRNNAAKKSFLLFIIKDIRDTRNALKDELTELEKKQEKIMYRKARKILIESSIGKDQCELCGKSPVDKKILEEELDSLIDVGISSDARNPSNIRKKIRLLDMAYNEAKEKIANPLKDIIRKIHDTKEDINAKEKKVERIKDELSGSIHGSERENGIKEIYKSTRDRITLVKYEIDNLQGRKGELKKKAKEKHTQLKRRGDVSGKYTRKIKQRELADKTEDTFELILEKSVHMNRERILDSANRFFENLTNKPNEYDRFEFATNETFEFQIVRKDNTKPNMDMISDGEKEIVAFSFVLGLSEYSQINAPLIMDNVNSRLDGLHRSKLATLLSKLKKQVIMLGIDKDFDYETKQMMESSINQEFEIERKEDKYSHIIER